MRIKSFMLCLLILCVAYASAQPQRLSAYSRIVLKHSYRHTTKARHSSSDYVRVMISFDSPSAIDELRAMGIKVHARFNGLVTASVPINHVPLIGKISGIRQLSVAQLTELCNDSALIEANVPPIAKGEEFAFPYDGQNVVVGVIDSGVDFNHINLCDASGKSRVVAAYLPQDSTGISPVIDGDTLPGSHYNTPEQIAALTTDDPTMSHGTHTTGTAAGSYKNGFHGVAPGARLVICAMPLLYDVDIANSIKYIFDYAERNGLPAVVNMSFANDYGPHDGSSLMCQLFDELSGPGRVLCVSAHNSGLCAMHLNYKFKSQTDTLSSTLEKYSSSFKTNVSFWSSRGHRHQVRLTLIDRTNKKQLLEMPLSETLPLDSVLTLEMDSIPEWKEYFTGIIQFATSVEDGDRSHSILANNSQPYDAGRHRLGIKVVSDTDPDFNAWASNSNYFRAILPGQKDGTKAGSISDLCTGNEAISVGAYISKQTYPLLDGTIHSVKKATPMHDIAYFSAWGPDQRGINRPDICAPGMTTISSASRYDQSSPIVGPLSLSFIENVNGVAYPYGASYGTSMSAPVMTGTIALWMQAYPQLSPDDVREILDHTAVRDQFVTLGDARQWGRGKLDATAGMKYLLHRINPFDVNCDGVNDIGDVNIVINAVLGFIDCQMADVNDDGIIDVGDINAVINALLGRTEKGSADLIAPPMREFMMK